MALRPWFEERDQRCALFLAINDASPVTAARFHLAETTDGYFQLIAEHL